MKQQRKFNSEHLSVLCKKGISILIVFALSLSLYHYTVVLLKGISEPFQDSEIAYTIFSQRLFNVLLISIGLSLQIFHLVTQKGGLITKLVIILLVITLGINLNIQYKLKSLQSNEINLTGHSDCKENAHKLWPKYSQQLYSEVEKFNCTNGCPCLNESANDDQKFVTVNFQVCLSSENRVYHSTIQNSSADNQNVYEVSESNSEQTFNDKMEVERIHNEQLQQRIESMDKLSQIEEALQCSGICESNSRFFFYDFTKSTEQNGSSCYTKAIDLIQKDVLLPTRSQSITIIFKIFLSKSSLIVQFAKSKLGACMNLPLSGLNSTPELKTANTSQVSEDCKQNVQIHILDLSKKETPIKNKQQNLQIQIQLSPAYLKTEENTSSPEADTPQIKLQFYKKQSQKNEKI